MYASIESLVCEFNIQHTDEKYIIPIILNERGDNMVFPSERRDN